MTSAPYLMSAPDIAEVLGITARRVTQYRDERLLPTIERGKFDVAFLMHLRLGEKVKKNARQRPDRDTLVAIGWLSSVGSNDLTVEDLDAFAQLFERNGLTRDQAMLALGRARGN